jgi:hypothetical protein
MDVQIDLFKNPQLLHTNQKKIKLDQMLIPFENIIIILLFQTLIQTISLK